MAKLLNYAEQAREVQRLVQEERYSIKEALELVRKEKKEND